jgi:hypothetical protein
MIYLFFIYDAFLFWFDLFFIYLIYFLFISAPHPSPDWNPIQ